MDNLKKKWCVGNSDIPLNKLIELKTAINECVESGIVSNFDPSKHLVQLKRISMAKYHFPDIRKMVSIRFSTENQS